MPDESSDIHPYWLREACPSWCIGGHAEMEYEAPELWCHLSGTVDNALLSTMKPIRRNLEGRAEYHPWIAVVRVQQDIREIDPRITLTGEHRNSPVISFTANEAQKVVDALVAAIDIATG